MKRGWQRLLCLLAHTLCLFGAHAGAAAQEEPKEVVVRLGLPDTYKPAVLALTNPHRCFGTPCLRYRFAFGSDYQVLEWLQNGKVDGAVVSPLTVELIRRSYQTPGPGRHSTNGAQRFADDFLVMPDFALPGVELRRYRVSVCAYDQGKEVRDPSLRLAAEYHAIMADKPAHAVIEVPSHLSSALPRLFFHAGAWLNDAAGEAGPDRPRLTEKLSSGLAERLEFSVIDARRGTPRRPARFILAERPACGNAAALGDEPSADLFLIRRHALSYALLSMKSSVQPGKEEQAYLDDLTRARRARHADTAFARFARENYVLENAGWRSRYRFSFTLDELRTILHGTRSPQAEGDDGIALILTGGGVKAAYQTKLIDHLYGRGYLRNYFWPAAASDPAVPVKFVIGTSGGALLGIFVAAIRDTAGLDLSKQIWEREDGQLLSSRDVFPEIDLMRWLSLLLCVLIFGVACALYSRHRAQVRAAPADEAARFWKLSASWLLLLVATPWLIRFANGMHAAEHIPVIEGGVYFVLVLIAVYSDNRFITRLAARQPGPFLLPALVTLSGVALALLAAVLARRERAGFEEFFQQWGITVPATIACAGVLLVFLGLQWWFERRGAALEPLPWRPILHALLLLAGICAASYLVLWGFVALGLAMFFELSFEFWTYLVIAAALVSVAVLLLAYHRWTPSAIQRRLRPTLDYLMSPHPSLARARYSRIIFTLAFGWAWWNLAVAPGIYGNQTALAYFSKVTQSVYGPSVAGKGKHLPLSVDFQAYYAAPVTALEKGVERYILFQPKEAYVRGGANGPAALAGYRSWLSITNDPRWIAIETEAQQRELLTRVAFASGSPFPVFPPHRIELPGVGPELLVDGGYAHNIPIEAAKRLNARRVLVINSSPREWSAPPVRRGPEAIGNLAMLRWVVHYLYDRSQVEDALSAEEIVVASVAPSASPARWPLLTDFRAEVIERLFDESRKDRALRIGVMESWGRPSFLRRSTPAGD